MIYFRLFGLQLEDGSWVLLLEALTNKPLWCDKLTYWWDSNQESGEEIFELMRTEFYLYQRLMRGQHLELVYAEFRNDDETTLVFERKMTKNPM